MYPKFDQSPQEHCAIGNGYRSKLSRTPSSTMGQAVFCKCHACGLGRMPSSAMFFCGRDGAGPGFVVSREKLGGSKDTVLHDCTIAQRLELKACRTPLTRATSLLLNPEQTRSVGWVSSGTFLLHQ